MLSRRDVLISAAAVGLAAFRQSPTVLATASQPGTPVSFDVPAGACDCHTHVFGDSRHFPFASTRTYTPEGASVDELRALHHALHVDRVVVVQPSVYAADNRCTLDAIRQLGAHARGVAVIDRNTRPAALDDMHRRGVRGIRLNLATAGQTDPLAARQRLLTAIEQIAGRPWHIQMYTDLSVIEAAQADVLASPVPVVFDHFGGAQAALGVGQGGFEALLAVVTAGKAYVKLSAPYRSSSRADDYADVAPFAQALIAANPQRMLWGTDWPHPDSSQGPGRTITATRPFQQIDDGRLSNQLAVWAPDAATRRTILVDNPARLYGF